MDIRTFFGRSLRTSRGGNSLHKGSAFELRCAQRLCILQIHGTSISVSPTAGGTHGHDIPTMIGQQMIGWEAKTKGGFEGGGTTLRLCNGRLVVPDKYPILKALYGSHVPWGRIPEKGENMLHDDYIDVPSDSVAQYYREKGTSYIIVEGKGIYHTGDDPLHLNVPIFSVYGMRLRTRTSKHKKNGKSTDISTALVFRQKDIPASPYSLFGTLPPGVTVREE